MIEQHIFFTNVPSLLAKYSFIHVFYECMLYTCICTTMQASLNEHDGAITCFATATSSNALPSLASLAQAAAAAANSNNQQEDSSQSSPSTSSKKSSSTSNSGSLLASGATDGTVRIWDLGASIPQASLHVLPSPYGGASVSTLAVAPSYWGSIGAGAGAGAGAGGDASSASGSASMANNKPLSIVVVGYGGASAQATPSMSVWHRGQVGCTDILNVHSCAHVP
jgi:WD40 repeat protein